MPLVPRRPPPFLRPRKVASSLPPALRDRVLDVEFSDLRVLVDGKAEGSEAEDESETREP